MLLAFSHDQLRALFWALKVTAQSALDEQGIQTMSYKMVEWSYSLADDMSIHLIIGVFIETKSLGLAVLEINVINIFFIHR